MFLYMSWLYFHSVAPSGVSFGSLQLGRILHQCLPVSIAWKHRRQEAEHQLRYRWYQQDGEFESSHPGVHGKPLLDLTFLVQVHMASLIVVQGAHRSGVLSWFTAVCLFSALPHQSLLYAFIY